MELAIKRAYNVWRVYEIIEGRDGLRWTHVVRDDGGQPLAFPTEDAARAYIESVPDATEVEYPA